MNRLALISLTLIVASCSGSTPESQPQSSQNSAQPPTSTASSASPLTVEWTDATLEQSADRNGYGAKKQALLERKHGALVFTPETEQDHIATPFTPLAPYTGMRSLELIVDASVAGGSTCAANLQDQTLKVLATVPCVAAGEQRQTVAVTPDVTGVRVYFMSATREPIQLPSRVRIVEHR